MKKQLHAAFFFLLLFLLGFERVYAQQELLYTQYMFDKMMYNPATAGIDSQHVNATGIIHKQWLYFNSPEGEISPIAYSGSIETPIRIKSLAKKNIYFGIGIQYKNDREVFFVTKNYLMSASVHFVPKFGGDLSIGINGGMINKYIQRQWIAVDAPGLAPVVKSSSGFNAGIGVYYNTDKWYAGISALHIPASKLDLGYYNYTVDRTYFITGGYYIDFKKTPSLQLQPSLLIKTDGSTTSFAVTSLLFYKHRFWGGICFRDENVTALSAMAGVIFIKGKIGDARIGLSYDIATQVPTAFGGTAEVLLSGRIKI